MDAFHYILADTVINLVYQPYSKAKQQKNRMVEVAILEDFVGEHIISLKILKYCFRVLPSYELIYFAMDWYSSA